MSTIKWGSPNSSTAVNREATSCGISGRTWGNLLRRKDLSNTDRPSYAPVYVCNYQRLCRKTLQPMCLVCRQSSVLSKLSLAGLTEMNDGLNSSVECHTPRLGYREPSAGMRGKFPDRHAKVASLLPTANAMPLFRVIAFRQ